MKLYRICIESYILLYVVVMKAEKIWTHYPTSIYLIYKLNFSKKKYSIWQIIINMLIFETWKSQFFNVK